MISDRVCNVSALEITNQQQWKQATEDSKVLLQRLCAGLWVAASGTAYELSTLGMRYRKL